MRELKVTGKGKVVAVPDQIVLNIDLNGTEKDYKKAYKQMEMATKEVRDLFQGLSFEVKDLKTKKCEVEVSNERKYVEKTGTWEFVFKGYEYVHKMKIMFDKDNDLLGKVLYGLSKCESRPEVNISYTVKDVKSTKNTLLKNAIADSKAKAAVLAEAAGVTLGDILKIDYSWGEINLSTPVLDSFLDVMRLSDDSDCFEDEALDMDIEPEDINITDTVTVIWEIQ